MTLKLRKFAGVEHVGGDMFVSVPKGDAIFMKVSFLSLIYMHAFTPSSSNIKITKLYIHTPMNLAVDLS